MIRRKGPYKKKDIDEMFECCAQDIGKLYDASRPTPWDTSKKSKLLNIVSCLNDEKENRNIEDYLAEKILNLKSEKGNGIKECLKNYFKENPIKKREKGYVPEEHRTEDIKFNTEYPRRRENNIVRLLYKFKGCLNKGSTFKDIFGEIIEYEAPLAEKGKNNIDMLTKTKEHINIIEWKTDSERCKDSLLRAMLEITTYEYELLKGEFIDKFKLDKKKYNENSFKKIIAIFDKTKPASTYKYIKSKDPDHKNIAKLLKELDIDVVLLSQDSIVKNITDDTKIEDCKIKAEVLKSADI